MLWKINIKLRDSLSVNKTYIYTPMSFEKRRLLCGPKMILIDQTLDIAKLCRHKYFTK